MGISFSIPGSSAAETDTLDSVTTRGATTTNSIQVGGVNVAGNYALPTADGTNGQVLTTDGSGSLSFSTVTTTGALSYKGSYNAATSTPSLTTALKGDFYLVGVAGTLAGVSLSVGDHIVFNQNSANPVTSAMFDVIDNSEADTLDTVTTRGATTANSVQVGGLNVAGNYNLPTVDGSANQAITTNGSGSLSFSTVLTDVVQDLTPQLGGPLDVNGQSITSAANGDITLDPNGTGEVIAGADVVPDADATHDLGAEDTRWAQIHGELNGAVQFKAKNDSGGVINKGQAVYIKGVSGTVPTVGLARANSTLTMPAFGLASSSANDQAELQVITFGNLSDYNTTTYSLALNDTVYVSAATAGALTSSAPSTEANLIQNIGRVIRADASAGIIKVGGAGRSNATPNLNDGQIFKGNASNQAESVALSSIGLSSFNNDLGLATVATTGAYSDLSGTPTLGTAASQDVGTSASNVVQLDGSARLPAVDGSQLTNLPSASAASETVAGVIEIATNAEAGAGAATDKALVPSNVSSLALSSSQVSGLATVATSGAYSDLSGTPTLGTAASQDVGTSASNVVQLDGSARLPAVDGSQLTNLPSASAPNVTAASPGAAYTITTHAGIEEIYLLTPSASVAVNLPAASAAGSGFKYNIKNLSGTYSLTLTPASGTIDGASTHVIDVQFESITIVSDGTNYHII